MPMREAAGEEQELVRSLHPKSTVLSYGKDLFLFQPLLVGLS